MRRVLIVFLACAAAAGAQVRLAAVQPSQTIQASGNATIAVNPDQATLDIGVVTVATTAQDSAAQNATQTTAVLAAIKTVLAGNGTVQTLYYSVSPRYTTGSTSIVGYTTSNTLRVTMNDLSIIGRMIDASNAAGANTVGGLAFGLQNSEPYTQQALTAATKQALAHAGAIASGLGGKIGPVVSAQEGSSYTPIVYSNVGGGVAASTPVQTGTVNVYASVTLVVQLQ